MSGLDFGEVVRKALKYLIEGIVVSLAAYYIPGKRKLNFEEILMIAITAAATFAILDMYTPAIGEAPVLVLVSALVLTLLVVSQAPKFSRNKLVFNL